MFMEKNEQINLNNKYIAEPLSTKAERSTRNTTFKNVPRKHFRNGYPTMSSVIGNGDTINQ